MSFLRKHLVRGHYNTKLFLFSFLYKHIDVEYHNAFTQTGPSHEAIRRMADKFSRDTQTVDISVAILVRETVF